MPLDEHPGCTELVELTEASLALGDAEAALQLLEQVDQAHRGNRWTATQVEALRMKSHYDLCIDLATMSLSGMIEERDWSNATRVLIASGRAFNATMRTHDCIVFLHGIEVMLRSVPNPNRSFRGNLLAMIASRVIQEGDLKTASELVSALEIVEAELNDWRVAANANWVRSQIAQSSGNVTQAIAMMDAVIRVYDDHDDMLARSRAISHLCWLVTMYIDVKRSDLLCAHSWIEVALDSERGDLSSSAGWWLRLSLAHVQLLLGNAAESMQCLEGLSKDDIHDESARSALEWVWALLELELGNYEHARMHLDQTKEIALQSSDDAQGREVLRRLAHLYSDLGDTDLGSTLLAMTKIESVDYSWCLPVFG